MGSIEEVLLNIQELYRMHQALMAELQDRADNPFLFVQLFVDYVSISVAIMLLEVYHDNILLSRHVSRYITISAYGEIGRVRVIRMKY